MRSAHHKCSRYAGACWLDVVIDREEIQNSALRCRANCQRWIVQSETAEGHGRAAEESAEVTWPPSAIRAPVDGDSPSTTDRLVERRVRSYRVIKSNGTLLEQRYDESLKILGDRLPFFDTRYMQSDGLPISGTSTRSRARASNGSKEITSLPATVWQWASIGNSQTWKPLTTLSWPSAVCICLMNSSLANAWPGLCPMT